LPVVTGQQPHLVGRGIAESCAGGQVDRIQGAQRCLQDVPLRESDGVAVEADDAQGSGVGGVGCVPVQQLVGGGRSDRAGPACSRDCAGDFDIGELALVITGRSPS